MLVAGELARAFEVRMFLCPPCCRKSFEERSEGNSGILGNDFLIRIICQLRILIGGSLACVFEVRMFFARPAAENVLRKDLKATAVY